MENDFWEEKITAALVVLDTAREKRKLSFQKALVEDQNGAAFVLAHEIAE